jgi:TolB-like protein
VTSLEEILHWISGNEALLSGIAALAAIAGLIVSPIGAALRRRAVRRRLRPAAGQHGGPQTAVAAPRAAALPQRVVAVLPFDNLSSDPELQYFSDGVSEEIIRRLSRGANIAVIGRASSFQFRAERKGEAARSLGCSHVLDGSVRRAAGRIRIVAHLVEATGTTTVWSTWPTRRRSAPAWDPEALTTTSWVQTLTAQLCCSRPACRNCATTRAFPTCARGSAWSSTGSAADSGPIAPRPYPTISARNARGPGLFPRNRLVSESGTGRKKKGSSRNSGEGGPPSTCVPLRSVRFCRRGGSCYGPTARPAIRSCRDRGDAADILRHARS